MFDALLLANAPSPTRVVLLREPLGGLAGPCSRSSIARLWLKLAPDTNTRTTGGGQAWYWLEPLKDFPHRWVACFDERRCEVERDAIFDEGWSQPICCSHPHFCRKLKDPRMYQAVDSLKKCVSFKSAVLGYARQGRVSNMHSERLLSSVRRASPAKLPYAERVLAAGLLTQWLRPHMSDESNYQLTFGKLIN